MRLVLIICAPFSLYVFYNLAAMLSWKPLLYSDPEKNNQMEQDLVFQEIKEERQRQRKNETVILTENKQGLLFNDKKHGITSPKNITKIRIGERIEDEHAATQMPRAQRRNLIILSPGRGGSSFLGSFFDSNSQIMYWVEPLRVVEEKIFHRNLLSDRAKLNYRNTCINVIDSTFKCDFTVLNSDTLSKFSGHNTRHCSKALTSGYLCRRSRCLLFSHALLSKACNSYNHTVIKVLMNRVLNSTIENLQELFQQENYDVRLVHLVRDPRAVVYSRINSVKWIKKSYLSKDFQFKVRWICDPIVNNLRFGLLSPPAWLKDRFKVIRYEDLAMNATKIAQELYRFAGFDWSTSVEKWINDHERQPSSAREWGAYTLYRNASNVIDKWKNAPKELIKVVEDNCGDLMDMLGYDKWVKGR